jgi:hypothetical protein
MATANAFSPSETLPTVEQGPASMALDLLLDPVVEFQEICKALLMNPFPTNPLEKPDINFLKVCNLISPTKSSDPLISTSKEIAKLPIDLASVPSGLDVQGMRHWIDNVYLASPLAETRKIVNFPRRRPEVPVATQDVRVPCSDGSNSDFGIRVYKPQILSEEQVSPLRPSILMFHGGGWIHGNPLGDEGQILHPLFRPKFDGSEKKEPAADTIPIHRSLKTLRVRTTRCGVWC